MMLSRFSQTPVVILRAATSSVQPKHGYGRRAGHPDKKSYEEMIIRPPRWKKHWAMGLKRKAEVEGEPEPTARRNIGVWNEEAEMNCFKIRLGIDMENTLLEAVFAADPSQPAPTSSPKSYHELCSVGEDFSKRFVQHYVSIALSKSPSDCQQSVINYLLKPSNLAHLATNLGYDDLVRSPIYPVPHNILADTFCASIGAISLQNPISCGRYILDFIIPQLVGKDILHDIWKPEDPMSLLVNELNSRSMPAPEARLVSQTGINTVTPMYIVALYSGQEFLCKSGAESIVLAEADAAKIALRKFYDIEECGKSLMMGNRVNEDFLAKLFQPLLVDDDLKIGVNG